MCWVYTRLRVVTKITTRLKYVTWVKHDCLVCPDWLPRPAKTEGPGTRAVAHKGIPCAPGPLGRSDSRRGSLVSSLPTKGICSGKRRVKDWEEAKESGANRSAGTEDLGRGVRRSGRGAGQSVLHPLVKPRAVLRVSDFFSFACVKILPPPGSYAIT